jgi:hypothetical protein
MKGTVCAGIKGPTWVAFRLGPRTGRRKNPGLWEDFLKNYVFSDFVIKNASETDCF